MNKELKPLSTYVTRLWIVIGMAFISVVLIFTDLLPSYIGAGLAIYPLFYGIINLICAIEVLGKKLDKLEGEQMEGQ